MNKSEYKYKNLTCWEGRKERSGSELRKMRIRRRRESKKGSSGFSGRQPSNVRDFALVFFPLLLYAFLIIIISEILLKPSVRVTQF